MTVKKYLSQTFGMDKEIKLKRDKIRELDAERMSVSSMLTPTKVQTSKNNEKLADLTAAFVDLQDFLVKSITQLLRLKYDILLMIDSIENHKQRLILTDRYINLKRWEDIKSDNYISWTTLHRIHEDALKALYKQHPDSFTHPK